MVTIRKMEESDWNDVRRIFQQGIDDGNATMHAYVPEYAQWDVQREKIGRLVAVMDGNVVGWTALTGVSSRSCYAGVKEVAIYVDRNVRGHGVGKALLQALIATAESEGLWMLESHIFSENTASRALHTSCGFRYVGYRERIGIDGNGVWHDTVLMEYRSHKVAWSE